MDASITHVPYPPLDTDSRRPTPKFALIDRAGPTPVHVTGLALRTETADDIALRLARHLSHIAVLDFYMEDTLAPGHDIFHKVLSQTAPLLTTFLLGDAGDNHIEPRVSLFDGHAPFLDTMDLCYAPESLSMSNAFSKPSTLSWDCKVPRAKQWDLIFAICQRLRSLRFSLCAFDARLYINKICTPPTSLEPLLICTPVVAANSAAALDCIAHATIPSISFSLDHDMWEAHANYFMSILSPEGP